MTPQPRRSSAAHRVSRRRLLSGSIAAGVLAAAGVPAQARARRGGRLRLALGGASAGDGWDSRRHAGLFMTAAAVGAVFDTLTEVTAEGHLTGELAQDWTASADARDWTFRLRDGVTFHDGSPFGAEDVIASYALHRDPGSPARCLVEAIEDMRPIGRDRLRIKLRQGNPNFPYHLSDPHLLIYPGGQIARAMAEGIGTGLYRLRRAEPGRRILTERVDRHFKDGSAGWFDEVEFLALNHPEARLRALLTDRVDAAADLDPRSRPLLEANRRLMSIDAPGNQVLGFVMRSDMAPFDDSRVRRAMKLAIDRPALVAEVFGGAGEVWADHPLGPQNGAVAGDLRAAPRDPAAARALLAEAGHDGLTVELCVSDAAFPGAVDLARLMRSQVAEAGITLTIRDLSDAGDRTAMPLRATALVGRPTEDAILALVTAPGSPLNQARWTDAEFSAAMDDARLAPDAETRAGALARALRRISDDGGWLLPVSAPFLGAASTRLAHGPAIGQLMPLDSARIAERWWMA
jgi:peptide/nickel transport system substrate-binding protein